MKTILIYLAGVATPFAAFIGLNAWMAFDDWRQRRRYARAWEKISAEFDSLTPGQLASAKTRWRDESYRFAHYDSDRSRYFAMRWNHGLTKEF